LNNDAYQEEIENTTYFLVEVIYGELEI